MSGFAPEGVLAALPETRAIRVLRKPFRREELQDALDNAMHVARPSARPQSEARE